MVYDVVGNSSNLEGLTIELNGTTANICTVPNYKPDSFTIIFIDNSVKEVVKEVPVDGNGEGKAKTITEYVDRYITKWRDKEPIIHIEGEDEKEDSNVWYFWLLIPFILICFLLYILIRYIQIYRNRREEKNR